MDGCENKFKEYVSGKTANFHTLSWFLILFEVSFSVFNLSWFRKSSTSFNKLVVLILRINLYKLLLGSLKYFMLSHNSS